MKCVMVSIIFNISSPDLICWYAWNESVPVRNILVYVMKFVCIAVSFVILLCSCFGLEFVTVAFLYATVVSL